jgi:hypothetical protein
MRCLDRMRSLTVEMGGGRRASRPEVLRMEGITTHQGLARALTQRGVATPRGGATWTHMTVARVIERLRP